MYRPCHTSIAETLFRSCQKLATCPPDRIYESNRAGLSISSSHISVHRNRREQLLLDGEMSVKNFLVCLFMVCYSVGFVIQYCIQEPSLLVNVVSVRAISGLQLVVSQLAHLPFQIS